MKISRTTSRNMIRVFAQQARTQRTLSERVADWLANKVGTTSFLVVNILFFFFWIVLNIRVMFNVIPFDPYPFSLLTMIVSLEAIMLSIVVLISQNRESRIANLREEVVLQMDVIAEKETTKALELLVRIAEKQGIDISNDASLKQMLKPTNMQEIENEIEKQM